MFEKIISELKKVKNILILTHHNADVDGVGSALALQEGLKQKKIKSKVGAAESVSKYAQNLVKGYEILIDPGVKGYDLIFVVDTSSPEQLEPIKISEAEKILVLDHHIPGKLEKIAKSSVIDPEAKSSAEMVYELLKEMKIKITPEIAVFLISGIVTDTAHLGFADKGTFELLTELLDKSGKGYQEILHILHTPIDFSERVARLKAAKRLDSYRIGETLVVFSRVGSFEAGVARSFLKLGADIAIVACLQKGKIRISGRCRNYLTDKIHLAEIFSKINDIIDGSGGGHDAAASANGKKPQNMEKAFRKILNLIEERLGEKAKKL
jgi:phosphoesterase RecJ-like protein